MKGTSRLGVGAEGRATAQRSLPGATSFTHWPPVQPVRTPLGASRPQAFGVLPFLLQHPSSTDLMSPWTPPGRDPSTARSARRHRPPRAAAACPAPPRPARTETPSRVCRLHVHVAGWPARTRRRGGPLGPPLTPQRWEGQRGQRVAMPAGPPSPSRRDGEEVDSHVD